MTEPTRIDALRVALNNAFETGGNTYVCCGKPLCEVPQGMMVDYCNWCYVISEGDVRPPEEIEQDIERQHRGH